MPRTLDIRILRGTESNILASSLNMGEMAIATDTKSVFISDGVGKILVGRAIIDTIANRPSPGVSGRYFFATDNGQLFIDNITAWRLIGIELALVDNEEFIYDYSRSRWLSKNRILVWWGWNAKITSRWIKLWGSVATNHA